jgi:hypothetical protein
MKCVYFLSLTTRRLMDLLERSILLMGLPLFPQLWLHTVELRVPAQRAAVLGQLAALVALVKPCARDQLLETVLAARNALTVPYV